MKRSASLPALLPGLLLAVGCQVTVRDADPPDPEGPTAPAATAQPTAQPTSSGGGLSDADKDALQKKLAGQKICTQMGCIDGYTLEVSPAAWPKGKYVLSLEADGKRSTCEATLPLPACDKGRAVTCKGDVEVLVGESGCALPPEQQGLGPLTFKGAPAKVSVAITRGGKEVGKGTFTPTYKTVQPNGPDCAPTCKHGTDSLTIK